MAVCLIRAKISRRAHKTARVPPILASVKALACKTRIFERGALGEYVAGQCTPQCAHDIPSFYLCFHFLHFYPFLLPSFSSTLLSLLFFLSPSQVPTTQSTCPLVKTAPTQQLSLLHIQISFHSIDLLCVLSFSSRFKHISKEEGENHFPSAREVHFPSEQLIQG